MLIDFPVDRESEQRQRETGERKEAVRVEIGNAWQEAVLANEETLSHCQKAFAIWQICLLISEFGSSKCCWPQSFDCCSTVGESTEIRMTVIHATQSLGIASQERRQATESPPRSDCKLLRINQRRIRPAHAAGSVICTGHRMCVLSSREVGV